MLTTLQLLLLLLLLFISFVGTFACIFEVCWALSMDLPVGLNNKYNQITKN